VGEVLVTLDYNKENLREVLVTLDYHKESLRIPLHFVLPKLVGKLEMKATK
jgi:hypothetical protein